jgi:hypothetical protein
LHCDGGGASAREHSTGKLVKQMTEQVSTLVRDELKLAQIEMSRKGKQAGLGVGLLGGGGLIAVYGVGCLIACAIIGISRVVQPWLGALIVRGGPASRRGRGRSHGQGRNLAGRAAGPSGSGRQREDRRGRDQGKGATLVASTLPGVSSAHPADEAHALRDEIAQTREHLGDTVRQLAARADVKERARAEAARLGERVRVTVAPGTPPGHAYCGQC